MKPLNLVTGGTGFLGAHLVAYLLSQQEPVRVLKRSGSSTSELDQVIDWILGPYADRSLLSFVEGDILDILSLEDALEGISTVYHCAAIVSFDQYNEEEMIRVNAEGTANLVNACLLRPGIRFCHVSSIAALGRKKAQDIIDEECYWVDHPDNSPYAISKYKAEMEVWRGIEEGDLNAVIVNPGVIVGAGNWTRGVPRVIKTVAQGFPFVSEGITGYVDVEDVARAIYLLAKSDIQSERFILVSENLSYRSFFTLITQAAGIKAPSFKVSPWMSAIAWRLFRFRSMITGKGSMVTRDTARASQAVHRYSSEKFCQRFGFQFRNIEKTVSKAVARIA